MLIAFGAAQLIGGIMMPLKKTRFFGAAIVASTFLVSLAILLMDGNIPVSIVTAIATLMLFIVMKVSWQAHAKESNGGLLIQSRPFEFCDLHSLKWVLSI